MKLKENIRVRSYNNFDPETHIIKEENNNPSLTVPSHTQTLREILEMYTKDSGIVSMRPVFQGDDGGNGDFLPDIEKMDIFERIDYARYLAESITATRSELTRKRKAKEELEGDEKKLLSLPKSLFSRLQSFIDSTSPNPDPGGNNDGSAPVKPEGQ